MTKEVSESSNLLFEWSGEKGTAVSVSPDASLFAVGVSEDRILLFKKLNDGWDSYCLPLLSGGEIIRLKLLSQNVLCFLVNGEDSVNFISWDDEIFKEASERDIVPDVRLSPLCAGTKDAFLERLFGTIHTFDIAQYGSLCWLGYSGKLVLARIIGASDSRAHSFSISNYSSFCCSSGTVFALNSCLDGHRVIFSTSESTSLHMLDVDASSSFNYSSYSGHSDWITCLKVGEENENLLLSGDSSGQVCFWDIRCKTSLVGSWAFFRSIAAVDFWRDPWKMMVAFGRHEDYIIEDEEPRHRGFLFSCVDLRANMLPPCIVEQPPPRGWGEDGWTDATAIRHVVSRRTTDDQVVAMDTDDRKSRIVYITSEGFIRVSSSEILDGHHTDPLLPLLSRRELGILK